MKNIKLENLDVNISMIILALICLLEIMDLIPDLYLSSLSLKLYGILTILSILHRAKSKEHTNLRFMTHGKMMKLYMIVSLFNLIFLEVVLIWGLKDFISRMSFTEEYVWNGILYLISLIVYPVSIFYVIIGRNS